MTARREEGQTITGVLDRLESCAEEETLSISDIVERMGERSFGPLLLVPALLMVSPLSGIPGSPTVSSIVIGLILVQMLMGRETLWLPRFIRDRRVASARFAKAVHWLKKPVSWVDAILQPRLVFLTKPPFSTLSLIMCLLVALTMPLMEVLPFAASIAAFVIALVATALVTRDGALMLVAMAVSLGVVLFSRTLFF